LCGRTGSGKPEQKNPSAAEAAQLIAGFGTAEAVPLQENRLIPAWWKPGPFQGTGLNELQSLELFELGFHLATHVRFTRGLADDQLGAHDDFFGKLVFGMGDFFKQRARGDDAHGAQRLANGGQAGTLVGGAQNVVEADDGETSSGTRNPASPKARIAPIAYM
jgi:hypothetical protein